MNVKKFYESKRQLKKFALEMLNHLNTGTKTGLLTLEDNIRTDTHYVVKVLLILLMNGTDPKYSKQIIEDLIIHSDLTDNEAAMVRMFSFYIRLGEYPEKVRHSVNLVFGLDITFEDLHEALLSKDVVLSQKEIDELMEAVSKE
ncbi:hypothetical protein KAS08_00420 [Candidatus Pacearchaeota archaeon]|nr:hypothetical protein [Candidatus Pacearchaeota archaeon]